MKPQTPPHDATSRTEALVVAGLFVFGIVLAIIGLIRLADAIVTRLSL